MLGFRFQSGFKRSTSSLIAQDRFRDKERRLPVAGRARARTRVHVRARTYV